MQRREGSTGLESGAVSISVMPRSQPTFAKRFSRRLRRSGRSALVSFTIASGSNRTCWSES
jgi:hypothetical protein